MIGKQTDAWIKAIARKQAQIVMQEVTRSHTDERPFCSDWRLAHRCPCHEDMDLIFWFLLLPQNEGLLTIAEAVRIYKNEQI